MYKRLQPLSQPEQQSVATKCFSMVHPFLGKSFRPTQNTSKPAAVQKSSKRSALMHGFEIFEKCLLLAEPEGYVRLFLETGEPTVDMLNNVKRRGTFAEYVTRLRGAFGDQQTQTKSATRKIPTQGDLIEPLTERELDVLRLICEGHSNQQIAAVLIVSINTIKKHTSNIYGKLGVRNRAQAVLRAREIGLI